MTILEQLSVALEPTGMVLRGAFHPDKNMTVASGTIAIVGNVDGRMWQAFQASTWADENPLDNWCEAILRPLAAAVDAEIVFPNSGPPYHPIQRWAQRADQVFPSPLGPLLHVEYGQWHAYRAALLFAERLDLPAQGQTESPCESCVGQPCRTACPVGAIGQGDYDVPTCVEYLSTSAGQDCLTRGCLARRACPIGAANLYEPAQAEFHMRAFLKAQARQQTKSSK